jgi:hypothetical protein
VFVTVNVYWIVSPTSVRPSPLTSIGVPACFTIPNVPVLAVFVIVQVMSSPIAGTRDLLVPAPAGRAVPLPLVAFTQDHSAS